MKNLILFPTNKDKEMLVRMKKSLLNENNIVEIYKEIGLLKRILRKIHFKFIRNYQYIWYEEWFKRNDVYENIVLFDSILNIKIVEDIRKKFPKSRIIFWYWNSIDNIEQIKSIKWLKEKEIEIWSFDKKDCKEFNLNYNTQFYFEDKDTVDKLQIQNRVYFIGLDKGRIEMIKKIANLFLKYNIEFLFEILKDNKKKYSIEESKYLIKHMRSYKKVLKYVKESKGILEINSKNQSGLTLRAMESLFYSKKLISNNKELKKIFNQNFTGNIGRKLNQFWF